MKMSFEEYKSCVELMGFTASRESPSAMGRLYRYKRDFGNGVVRAIAIYPHKNHDCIQTKVTSSNQGVITKSKRTFKLPSDITMAEFMVQMGKDMNAAVEKASGEE